MTPRQFKDRCRMPVNLRYDANTLDGHIFVADRGYRVVSIVGRPRVAGSDGGDVTGVIRKCDDAEAPSAGEALHSGTYNFKGTADTNQSLDLDATKTHVKRGQSLALDLTGTMTAAVGVISILLEPTP